MDELSRARYAINAFGDSMAILQSCQPSEISQLATLVNSDAVLVDDFRDKYLAWKAEFCESRKANEADEYEEVGD